MDIEAEKVFNKVTKRKQTRSEYQINCRLGLFGVSAPTKDKAEREAWRYFIQYYDDGEYNGYMTDKEHAAAINSSFADSQGCY